MKRLTLTLATYLERLGRLEVGLGPHETRAATQEDSSFLAQQLQGVAKADTNTIAVMTVFLGLAYGPGVLFTFYKLPSPGVMGGVLSGALLALWLVVAKLRQLWHEKSLVDVVLSTLPELSPEQVVQLVEILYWDKVVGGTVRHTARPIHHAPPPVSEPATAPAAVKVQRQGWETFCRELSQLLAHHSGQWVAFWGERQVALSTSKQEVYEQLLQVGCPLEEVIVRRIEPLGPPVDLRRQYGMLVR